MTQHVEKTEGDLLVKGDRNRRPFDYFGLFLRGVAMGTCDVIPGVSGGTIAFITGIYEELIASIRAIGRPEFLKPLMRFRLVEAARAINLPFLLSVLLGVAVAILSLAKLMTWLLDNQPTYTWAFFFGLVLASVIVVSRKIPKWRPLLVLALLISAVATFFLVGMVPAQTPDDLWFVFICGALAICAMILPGISGAFILVILGKYRFVLESLPNVKLDMSHFLDSIVEIFKGIKFDVVLTFIAGAVIGLVSFSQLLGWLFKRYHNLTVAILTGLMLGSLRKLWPWRETVDSIADNHGKLIPTQEHLLFPGMNSEFFLALGLAIIGFIAVILLERIANRNMKEHV